MFHSPIKIHGFDFSEYGQLSDYIQLKYPKQHAQHWERLFPDVYSIIVGATISAEEFAVVQMSLKKTQCNELGGKILLLLGVLHEPASPTESTSSNDEVNVQEPSVLPEFHDLEQAFSSVYIDPHGFAEDVFDTLLDYMEFYCSKKVNHIAPYTSLITSSMMGKSRLLKQVANRTPLVYICLRDPTSSGYPKRSRCIADWLLKGVQNCFKGKSMSTDVWSFLGTLKFSAFMEATLNQLANSINTQTLNVEDGGFGWLWDFFAEPRDDSKLKEFWEEVIKEAENILCVCFDKDKNACLPEKARDYLNGSLPESVSEKLLLFWESVTAHGYHDRTLPFLFVFDEARSLCETDTDGLPVLEHYSKYQDTPILQKGKPKPSPIQLSNFKALRRALRYLSNKDMCSGVARVFGVFTDTTSSVTDFQPAPWDESSGRFADLPAPGIQQFPPLYLFASIDVHSRLHNTRALSRPEDVATVSRLLKFGRAGWFSIYQQVEVRLQREVSKSGKGIKGRDSISRLIGMAMAKLTNSSQGLVEFPTKPKEFLQHLAALSPRLALSIGPYNVEASELVASHLAVLAGTDDERHFLRIHYPSEPFLAEVSAICTKSVGWQGPLKALNHYIVGGVVDAGFRGELLTKLTCLMAMDHFLNSSEMGRLPPDQLRFSRAVRVSQFLNTLITPRTGSKFCEMLHGVTPDKPFPFGTLNVEESKLQTFLNGYVFFNHFIRVEVKVTIPMLVHAWNRGAAIMCQTGTKGIDHIIPVILRPTERNTRTFGPLHDEWTEDQCRAAARHVSYILINSRNYAAPKKQFAAAWAAKLSDKNFEPYDNTKSTNRPETVEQLLTQADEDGDEDQETDDENDLGPDCPVMNFDELDQSWNPQEFEARKAKKLERMQIDKQEQRIEGIDNVFLSLVQDFGSRSKNEAPVSVGEILPERRLTRPSKYRDMTVNPITQFVIVLKGIGPETYGFLRDDVDVKRRTGSLADLDLTRRYLKELQRSRYNYVENRRQLMAKFKDHKPIDKSLKAIVEGLPLVFNSDRYTSEPWRQLLRHLQESERNI